MTLTPQRYNVYPGQPADDPSFKTYEDTAALDSLLNRHIAVPETTGGKTTGEMLAGMVTERAGSLALDGAGVEHPDVALQPVTEHVPPPGEIARLLNG